MAGLKTRTWLGFSFLAAVMGLLFFVPAGTLQYWHAWAYLGVFFGASLLLTLYLLKRDPAHLQRRLRAGPAAETRRSQKFIMIGASGGFISLLLVAALDYRLGWSRLPPLGAIKKGNPRQKIALLY